MFLLLLLAAVTLDPPASLPFAQFQINPDKTVSEDYGRAVFTLNDKDFEVKGRHWQSSLYPQGDVGSAQWSGSAEWKKLLPLLQSKGWKIAAQDTSDGVLALLRRGDEWVKIRLTEGDAYSNYAEYGAPAPPPPPLALKPPAAQPETVPDDAGFPWLTPLPGSKFIDTQTDDAPMTFDEKVVAPGSVLKRYECPPTISNLAFVTVYAAALKKAGWDVFGTSEGAGQTDATVSAHYAKNGRDLWLYLHHGAGDWSARVGDAGAAALAEKLKRDCKVAVYGLNFDFDKATLRPDSEPVLQQLLQLFKSDASLSAELSGHTDNVGKPDYNLKLSQNRAGAVKAWLVQHGVDGARITTAGYGDSKPVAPNDDAAGRAKNRRVELARKDCSR